MNSASSESWVKAIIGEMKKKKGNGQRGCVLVHTYEATHIL